MSFLKLAAQRTCCIIYRLIFSYWEQIDDVSCNKEQLMCFIHTKYFITMKTSSLKVQQGSQMALCRADKIAHLVSCHIL